MKIQRTLLFLLPSLAFAATTAFPQSGEQEERIGASYVLALGRPPSPDEIGQWSKQGNLSVGDLIARHRQQLQSDAGVMRATVVKACADAFGREPTEPEVDAWSAGNRIYTELMKQHVQWLGGHPQEYRQVIERAYQLVMRRPAYPVEIDYWKAQPTLSYALLVGCIEDWARRNAPGLMATTGTPTVSLHSAYLTTFRLAPGIADEARAAVGLVPTGDANLVSAAGRNLVAAGAGNVVTSGHINFVAAGGASLLPTRNGG
jgi:hypothetical protein